MKVLDRLKTIKPHKLHNGLIVPRDTYGTVRNINEHNITMQVGIDLDKARRKSQGLDFSSEDFVKQRFITLLVTFPDLILSKVTQDELNKIDYRYIVPKIFHPGNMWSIDIDIDDKGDPIYKSGIIEEYFLTTSEDEDEITLTFLEDIFNNCKDGIEFVTHKYKKRYLDIYGSYSVIIE